MSVSCETVSDAIEQWSVMQCSGCEQSINQLVVSMVGNIRAEAVIAAWGQPPRCRQCVHLAHCCLTARTVPNTTVSHFTQSHLNVKNWRMII